MKIEKATLALEGTNQLMTCDVILHDGKWWLVPEWTDSPATGETKPTRLICLSNLRHQDDEAMDPRFVLSDPIPKALLDGRVPPGSMIGFVVLDRPDITMRGGSHLN